MDQEQLHTVHQSMYIHCHRLCRHNQELVMNTFRHSDYTHQQLGKAEHSMSYCSMGSMWQELESIARQHILHIGTPCSCHSSHHRQGKWDWSRYQCQSCKCQLHSMHWECSTLCRSICPELE